MFMFPKKEPILLLFEETDLTLKICLFLSFFGVKRNIFLFNGIKRIIYFCCCTKLATSTPDAAISESYTSDPDLSSHR